MSGCSTRTFHWNICRTNICCTFSFLLYFLSCFLFKSLPCARLHWSSLRDSVIFSVFLIRTCFHVGVHRPCLAVRRFTQLLFTEHCSCRASRQDSSTWRGFAVEDKASSWPFAYIWTSPRNIRQLILDLLAMFLWKQQHIVWTMLCTCIGRALRTVAT